MAIVRRGGEVYSSGDVTVMMAGINDVDPLAIEYGYKYDHKRQQGLKRDGRGWSMGKGEYECKLTLSLDVAAEFEKVAPKGNLAMIRPFPINVAIINSENEMIRDLIWCKFTGNKRSVKEGEDLANEFEMFVTRRPELNIR